MSLFQLLCYPFLKIHPEVHQQKANVGDFINIPAGHIHGIGENIKVFEVQQPSDITYRFYDYGRLQDGLPRELHIEKSLKALKDVDTSIKSSSDSENYDKYELEYCDISIFKERSKAKSKGIVVDFKSEEAFLVSKGEEIDFSHWALVSWEQN